MKYTVRFSNTRRFQGAFYDTDCQACEAPIAEGDPIGRIENEDGYLCHECINDLGDDGFVHTTK